MRKYLWLLLLMMSLSANAQQRQISYVETSSSVSWYHVYDTNGKKITTLAQQSVGELIGWSAEIIVTLRQPGDYNERMKDSDLQLLKQLYAIHSPTGSEWPLICFIREYVATHIPEAKVRIDRMGNLYIIKGVAGDGYPTLVCHLDQVQALHSDDFEVRQDGDMLYGWSEQNQRREGLGADDKNGIFVCLRCLEQCEHLKVFMAVGEEKGCIGSNRADMSFFADSLYVLEPDCKGGEEIHTNLRGIPCACPDFEQALEAEVNGYTITDGKTSDIIALTLSNIGVSCANIPAGYHLPHKDDEYTVLSELTHTLSYVRHLVQILHRRFPHEYKSETQYYAEAELSTK